MRLVWQFLAVAVVALIGGQIVGAVRDNPWLSFGIGVLTAVLSVLVYGWMVRRTEHRPSTEVAWKGAVPAMGRGALLGVALFAGVIANLSFLGYYEIHGLGSPSGAVGLFGFMAGAAVTEEVMFRGVLFRIIEERTGTWIALSVTSVLFGAWHLPNPDAGVVGAVTVALWAGPMLGAAYIATRKLWVPIGLHFGWNFAASALFSTEVSGNDTHQGLLDSAMSGNALLTGGEFGPEASPYTMLFCGSTAIVFLWLARRRGLVVPRRRTGRAEATVTLAR